MDEELIEMTDEEYEEYLEWKRECQDEGDDYYRGDDRVKDDCYYSEWEE